MKLRGRADGIGDEHSMAINLFVAQKVRVE
jgi:hypothetical protein